MKIASFRDKLLKMQSVLRGFAIKLTSNKDDADDLVQETSLRALDSEDKYEENENFKGWVFTIMRNIFINNYRKVLKNQMNTTSLSHATVDECSNKDITEMTVAIKEINSAIDALPEEYRIPISLYLKGYTYKEISDIIMIPLGSVKSRIFYARKELQNVLHDFR